MLRVAAEKAGWRDARAAGRALGLAVQEANNGTFIAQVVEAGIDGGAIRVHRVVCAVDCGIAVNPDIVRAQVEGGIAFGLTQALHGELSLKDGRVVQTNFDSYRVLRMPEMPRSIEVHIVEGGARAPTGIGEPGSVLAAAALANAIASLTGRPVRTLPLSLA